MRRDRLAFTRRVLSWQIGARLLRQPVAVDFVNDLRLLLRKGDTGLTVHYYSGLYEFDDMLFVAHALRSGDLFLDVGANAGAYTVLAAGAALADVIALEPVPHTFDALIDNINLNRLSDRVDARNLGAGSEAGVLRFSTERAAENRVVVTESNEPSVTVEVTSVDAALAGHVDYGSIPLIIKIDVEGWEWEVLQGATRTLANWRPCALLVEMNQSGARYGFSERRLHELLVDHGFIVARYDGRKRRLLLEQSGKGPNRLFLSDAAFFEDRLSAAPPLTVGKHVL